MSLNRFLYICHSNSHHHNTVPWLTYHQFSLLQCCSSHRKPSHYRHYHQHHHDIIILKRCIHHQKKSSSKEYLYGASCVLPALMHKRRSLFRLLTLSKHEHSLLNHPEDSIMINDAQNSLTNRVMRLARRIGLTSTVTSRAKLDMLTQNRPHQGIVLECGPLLLDSIHELSSVEDTQASRHHGNSNQGDNFEEYQDYKVMLTKKSFIQVQKTHSFRPYPLWIALENIMDPQNLGAIIRSCHFFHVDGIVMTTRETSPLSATVSKASVGALEAFPNLFLTSNLSKFLNNSAINGWKICGTDIHSKSARVLKPMETLAEPTILVLGNEGSGLSKNVVKACHEHFYIGRSRLSQEDGQHEENLSDGSLVKSSSMGTMMKDEQDCIDSLNVSVATGILLNSFSYQTQ